MGIGSEGSFVSEIGNVKNPNDILIGWIGKQKVQAGFSTKNSTFTTPEKSGNALYTEGGGHSLTISPTGGGKTVALISRLLRNPQSCVVCDFKNEIRPVVERYRRDVMGHEIITIDPTASIKGAKQATFNPLDIMDIVGEDPELFSQDIVSCLLDPGMRSKKEAYWDIMAEAAINKFLLEILINQPKEARNLVSLWQRVYGEARDTAVMLDEAGELIDKKPLLEKVIKVLGNFLGFPDNQRQGVFGTAMQYFTWLTGTHLEASLKSTSFDLEAMYKGTKKFTVFITIPPWRMIHSMPLLRIYLHAFMLLFFKRQNPQKNPIRLVIDEAAGIGNLDILTSLLSIGRGYGLYADIIYQDFSQIKTNYPTNYENIINNCRYLFFHSFNNFADAEAISNITGYNPQYLMEMDKDDMLFVEYGKAQIVRKINYLKDSPHFNGRYDANPFYM